MLWIDVMEEAALPEGGMAAVYPLGDQCRHRPRQRDVLRGLRPGARTWPVRWPAAHWTATPLTCPCHDWRLTSRTGQFLRCAEIKLEVLSCKIRAGRLFVGIG